MILCDLLLQLQYTVEQRLSGRRAARHVYIHRDDAVTAAHNSVRVVVVTTAVGARTHGYDPAGLCHLVVHLAKRGCHLSTHAAFVGLGKAIGNNNKRQQVCCKDAAHCSERCCIPCLSVCQRQSSHQTDADLGGK